MKKIILVLLLIVAVSCKKTVQNKEAQFNVNANVAEGPSATTTCFNTYSITDSVQVEKDKIFSLLSLGVVYKNWQTPTTNPVRGYNIGSILVAPSGQIVKWARNCVDTTGNSTQHGEVRLMTSYLGMTEYFSLKDEDNAKYVLYTSLEPCAMCSGMMTLQSLGRTVYSQTDPDFGKAIQRLEFDASACGGCPPYPRAVISDASPSKFRTDLDIAYKNYISSGGSHITQFLTSPEAQNIYANALKALMTYQVQYPENQAVVDNAISFYNNVVTDHYLPLSDNNDVLTSVFTIKGEGINVITSTGNPTYASTTYIVSNSQVFTTLSDIDADAIFTIANASNNLQYVTIDSGGNINTGAAYVSYTSQPGVQCTITQTKVNNNVYYFDIVMSLAN